MAGVSICQGQDVLFSQSYKNPIYLNPALTALRSCGRAYMHYRNASWGVLDHTVYSLAFDLPFEETQSGFGGLFQWQEEGIARIGKFGFQFSQKVRFTEDLFMTLGMEAGGIFRTWNMSQMQLPSDIVTTGNGGTPEKLPTSFVYDLAAGAGLNYKKQYMGFAVRHITENDVKSVHVNSQIYRKYVAHYIARIPYKLPGMRSGFFSPQMIFEKQKGNNHLTSGVYAFYENIGGGLWIRNHLPFKASYLIIMAAIKRRNFEFSYSYDFPVNGSGVIAGAHEIALIYYLPTFKKRYKKLKHKNCLSF